MATYEELKKKRDAAQKAAERAFATINATDEEFSRLKIAHNEALPDGWYAESSNIFDDFPIYLKQNGTWFWHSDQGVMVEPEWLGNDGFDIEVFPLSDVKI